MAKNKTPAQKKREFEKLVEELPSRLKRRALSTLIDDLGIAKAKVADAKIEAEILRVAVVSKLVDPKNKIEKKSWRAIGKIFEVVFTRFTQDRFNKELFIQAHGFDEYNKYLVENNSEKLTVGIRKEVKEMQKKF